MWTLIALTLVVRLADATHGSSPALGSAQREATAILCDAGVEPQWVVCGKTGQEPVCRRGLEPGELVVRFARRGVSEPGGILGSAVVDSSRGTGTLATIWVDAVGALATAAGIDRDRLMGRAVAHEIGHLLLGTTRHPETGLMRAVWSLATLRGNRSSDWTFTEREKREIQLLTADRRSPALPSALQNLATRGSAAELLRRERQPRTSPGCA